MLSQCQTLALAYTKSDLVNSLRLPNLRFIAEKRLDSADWLSICQPCLGILGKETFSKAEEPWEKGIQGDRVLIDKHYAEFTFALNVLHIYDLLVMTLSWNSDTLCVCASRRGDFFLHIKQLKYALGIGKADTGEGTEEC